LSLVPKKGEATGLWFERVYGRLGVPLWVGVFLLTTAPIVSLEAIAGAGQPVSFYYLVLSNVVLIPYLLYGSVVVRRAVERAAEEARDALDARGEVAAMSARVNSVLSLRPLYGTSGVIVCWALVETIFALLFYVPSTIRPYELSSAPLFVALGVAGNAFFTLIEATILWVFVYSMYSLYRMGGLPLRLKPFTEDRTLGLRLFGTTSLKLVSIYEVYMALLVITISFVSGIENLPFLSTYVASFLFGLAIFLLPLLSFRRKLIKVKAETTSILSSRYTQLVNEVFASSPDAPIPNSLNNDIATVKQILQDVRQVYSWPFDTGVATRAGTTIVIPLMITIVGREVLLQLLHA
jgi:hypothetical protein